MYVENEYFRIELFIYQTLYHRELVEKNIEIIYSCEDRNEFSVSNRFYSIEFDDSYHDHPGIIEVDE